ncbi:MAG: methyltransferase domain-containing protein [Theionarchaea archaeon]|nr:methyltransferase domain-containing protein [Theionarchaea archaeon]
MKEAIRTVLHDFLDTLDEDVKILDAATGSGETTLELAQNIHGTIISADIDLLPSAQEKIRREGLSSKVEFITANLAHMESIDDSSIDGIVSHATVSALPSETPFMQFKVFTEFYRVLKPSGALIIIDYYPLNEVEIKNKADRIAQEAWRVYKAVAELVGDSHHEEIPPQRIIELLEWIGFRECTYRKISERTQSTTFGEYVQSMQEYVKKVEDTDLQKAFQKKITCLNEQEKIHGKSDYSDTYCVWAKK